MHKWIQHTITGALLFFVGANFAYADTGSACTKLEQSQVSINYVSGRVFNSPFLIQNSDKSLDVRGHFTLYVDGKFRLHVRTLEGFGRRGDISIDSIESLINNDTRCLKNPEECRKHLSSLLKILEKTKSAANDHHDQSMLQCAVERVGEYIASLPGAPVETVCKENVLSIFTPDMSYKNTSSRVVENIRQMAPRHLVIEDDGGFANSTSDYGKVFARGDLVILYYSDASFECAMAIHKMYPYSYLKEMAEFSKWDFKKKKVDYGTSEERVAHKYQVRVFIPEL
mgnify:CR=1 FL=1